VSNQDNKAAVLEKSDSLSSAKVVSRVVSRVIKPQSVIEGAGVNLRRSISPQRSNEFDPFLLWDHFYFDDPIEGPLTGFPMHPHRGIETVTYMLEGSMHHRDSLGNSGLIGLGDVQWMTSGRGILHEEMPRRSPNGIVNGFQLWVNLPASLKMTTPRYQDVQAEPIPQVTKDGVSIRVMAGEVWGTSGPVTDIAAGPLYLDVTLDAGASFAQTIPDGHTVLAYVFEGEGSFGVGREAVEAVHMVEFGEGNRVECHSETGMRFMLLAGAPFREPIVPYGPFVMNTEEEIRQAFIEYRQGTFIRP
jgi:redox-sensitive bicupin YhaK (pirin superfamily)